MRVLLTHLLPDISLALTMFIDYERGVFMVSNDQEPKGLQAMVWRVLSNIAVINIILGSGSHMDILAAYRGCDRCLKMLSLDPALQFLLPAALAKIDPASSKNNQSKTMLDKFYYVPPHLTVTSISGGII